MFFNAVVISVLVLVVLSLLRIHVIFALLAAAFAAGLMSNMPVKEIFETLIGGMGGQGETALSYILLGIFAVMIARSGITNILIERVLPLMKGRRAIILFTIAGLACFSQNLVPVHIAFIPILIPPLLTVFDKLKIDRRGVATALTFGLKAPYILIPFGFGYIFHKIIAAGMEENGMAVDPAQIPIALVIPVLGMVAGLIIGVLFTYRKPREYAQVSSLFAEEAAATYEGTGTAWNWKHTMTIAALVVAVVLQFVYEILVISALAGIVVLFLSGVVSWKAGDDVVQHGVRMMGAIAFVMLIASGYATILTETGAVDELVTAGVAIIGESHFMAAVVLLIVGLLITMGIGTSFGTIPILAAIYVPFCLAIGFSPLATIALIGTAGALGDAGSPASDSTLGPTSGLNADGQHNHIWDTCVPTFVHYNIPLLVFGVVAALVL